MKRLILLATMMVAVLASCEKHEIRNEVLNEIGFTSKVGKQTKAIAQNESYADGAISTYFQSQPFGVFAYGHQESSSNKIMKNTPIVYNNSVWKDGYNEYETTIADTTYYWPNSSTTTINFYAYSPFIKCNENSHVENVTASLDNHKKINGTISHSESSGLTLTDYTHSNMYVDFMVATPVIGAKYNTYATDGTVTLKFNHQLTQLVFNVKTNSAYPGITFTVNSITLNNINNNGTYACSNVSNSWVNGTWSNQTGNGTYNVFPAIMLNANTPNGAPIDANEEAKSVTNTVELTTTPITVIPQTLAKDCQSLTINYSISGTGVATETVNRTVYFYGIKNNGSEENAKPLVWDVNKKITYNILIGLNEIKFSPTIENWSDETSANQTITQ